jgi:hypothetical protein
MNLAQMLAERMKSPGALAEFKDRTTHPERDAAVTAGDNSSMPGSGKQEPFPLDAAGMSDGDGDDQAPPGDAGLGMLESAHASMGNHGGKKKVALGKAIEHGKKKMGHHAMPPHKKH